LLSAVALLGDIAHLIGGDQKVRIRSAINCWKKPRLAPTIRMIPGGSGGTNDLKDEPDRDVDICLLLQVFVSREKCFRRNELTISNYSTYIIEAVLVLKASTFRTPLRLCEATPYSAVDAFDICACSEYNATMIMYVAPIERREQVGRCCASLLTSASLCYEFWVWSTFSNLVLIPSVVSLRTTESVHTAVRSPAQHD